MKQKFDSTNGSLTVAGGDSRPTTTPSLRKDTSSPSTTIRFFSITKQTDSEPDPDPNPNPFEFDESDVVWSSSDDANYQPPPSVVHSPPKSRIHHDHLFRPEKSGLSAALADEHHPMVRRKSNLNPSVSTAVTARKVAPIKSESFSGGKFLQSAPVNVPVWGPNNGESGRVRKLGHFDYIDDDFDDEIEGKMIPPHEIVARSHVTFSVFEGVGRTLKGRDLRRVRNAVFQRTGFID